MMIVSQDKDKIFNFNNLTQVYITTSEEETEYEIRCETVDSLYDTLGIYKTEKRAKEVLREMIRVYRATSGCKYSEIRVQVGIIEEMEKEKLNPFIYEMPEE